jgi:hypothetical protein
MKTEITDEGVRPMFVVLLGCAVAVIVIPMWMLKSKTVPVAQSSAPAVEAPAPAPAPRTMAPGMTAPKPPVIAQRATPPPRSTVSREVKMRKSVVTTLPATNLTTPEQRWGIQVCSARLIMGNAFVDLRYKIVNPEKASLLAGNTQAYIFDPATGAKFALPTRPKEGSFPPTGNRLSPGRTLFAVVGNPGGVLKSGSKVSVVIGDSIPTDLVIE